MLLERTPRMRVGQTRSPAGLRRARSGRHYRVTMSDRVEGHGGDLVAEAIRAHGVDRVYTLSGGHIFPIFDGLHTRGMRIIIAGLDQDYMGRPFGPMPQLLAIAEYITKTHAICVRCGQPANYSQRIVDVEGQVVVGAANEYEARCRRCFVPHADAPTRHLTE